MEIVCITDVDDAGGKVLEAVQKAFNKMDNSAKLFTFSVIYFSLAFLFIYNQNDYFWMDAYRTPWYLEACVNFALETTPHSSERVWWHEHTIFFNYND